MERDACMKCGKETNNLVYIRDWRKKGFPWVCEHCERIHMKQNPDMIVPREVTQSNRHLLK